MENTIKPAIIKALTIFAVLISWFAVVKAQDGETYAPSENYIETYTPFTQNLSGGVSSNNSLITRLSLDCFEIPEQYVLYNVTPAKGALAIHYEHSKRGQLKREWLPMAHQASKIYYNFDEEEIKGFYNDDAPCISNKFFGSTQDIIQKAFPGKDWNGRAVQSAVSANQRQGDKSMLDIYMRDYIIISSNTYSENNYDIHTVTDEDGSTVYEFKNIAGNTVLRRQFLYGEHYDTYFCYDGYGRVIAIIPPASSDNISAGYNLKNDPYVYLYEYDDVGNMTQKKLPGADPIYYLYDIYDRMILSQNGNQRAADPNNPNKWTFYLYDRMNRMVVSGETVFSPEYDYDYIKETIPWDHYTVSYQGEGGAFKGYSNPGLVGDTYTILTATYYDDYDFTSMPEIADKGIALTAPRDWSGKNRTPRTLVTGKFTALANDPSQGEYSAFYYDPQDRTALIKSNLMDSFTESTSFSYSFPSLLSGRIHKFTWFGQDYIETTLYTYDHAGRLIRTGYKYGGNAEITLSENIYDPLGKLVKKLRYNGADTISYAYNIRGWIKRINSKSFSQKLYYQDQPEDISTTPCYNGNVSAAENNYEYYGFKQQFEYDQLNRLKQSGSKEPTHSSVSFYESFDYDKMGNITAAYRRYGMSNNYHNISMAYNGNQIKKASITYQGQSPGPDQMRYPDISNADTEYYYDKNGNLRANLDYGIAAIRNNILNLPDTVQLSNGNQQINMYMADGRKVGTESRTYLTPQAVALDNVTQSSDPRTTIYQMQLGNIFVDDFIPTRIYNDEGYISIYNMETGEPEFKYYFYNKDYLGNNMTVKCLNDPEAPIQQNRYFPSGAHIGEIVSQNPEQQPYKFGGKEFIPMHGIDWYDFSARTYSPMVGRFNSIDPLAEKYPSISPYAYCANNPVKYIDPTGMRFTEVSQQYIATMLNRLKEMRASASASVDNLRKTYENKATRLNGQNLKTQEDLLKEVNMAIDEIVALDRSSQVYNITIDESLIKDDQSYGKAWFDQETGMFNMAIQNESNILLSHELKHAAQFENGELSSGKRKDGAPFYDQTDEVAAYKRASIFGGEARSSFSIANDSHYGKFQSGPKDATMLAPVMLSSPQALQKMANVTGAAFRINGVTYVPNK